MSIVVAALAGCGSQPVAPDAPPPPPSTVPISPAGGFAVSSWFDVRVPPAAGPVLATLTAATDGPDDPSRYVVDRMVATLPEGPVKVLAAQLAPYVAAYLNARLVSIAPRLVAGVGAIADGMSRIAGHLGTVETLQLDDRGAGVRTITGVRFAVGPGPVVVSFADAGLADIAAGVRVTLDAAGHLAIADHTQRLPYGALLRLGLDRAVVPSIEPAARDLASAFAALVDCERIGALVADRVGLGSPALYRAACETAMTAIASEIDARLAAIDDSMLDLEISGAATGVDLDADGTMDELRAGSWTGYLDSVEARTPLDAGSFAGHKAPPR